MENVEILSRVQVDVIQVVATAGTGVKDDPERTVYLYFDFQGRLLAMNDPINDPDYQSPHQPVLG